MGSRDYDQPERPQIIGHTVELDGSEKDGSGFPLSFYRSWTTGMAPGYCDQCDMTERKRKSGMIGAKGSGESEP